jgi:hypothetical protein
MIRRILLAAALLATPAIILAEQPAQAMGQTQQTDSTKAKKTSKKKGHKKVAKPAAKDTSKAKM